MPMGALNAAPVFAAMMMCLQREWQANADAIPLPDTGSEVIIDDVMLFAMVLDVIMKYFEEVLKVLQKYRATLKLKKCRFLGERQEFVGVDILSDGNTPASSKNDAFSSLDPPLTFSDIRMLIGMFGFYSLWIPWFEKRVRGWRAVLRKAPAPKTAGIGQRKPLGPLWTKENNQVLEQLKTDILEGPLLARPDSSKRHYLKTDWSKEGFGATILQAHDNPNAHNAEHNETTGGPCTFDATITNKNLRLRPIAFISRRCSDSERNYHSYVGEAATGIWAIEKFRHFLFGREFTWITDCSGLRQFFEGIDTPSHIIQRWRLQLLRYNFTIVHRPSRMMAEVDLLSRYNAMADDNRENDSKP